MKRHVRTLVPVLITFFAAAGAQTVNAQIIAEIHSHIDHTFVIGDKTLPPGEYTFRMTEDPDESLMIATNQNGRNVAQFAVRQSIDDHRPSSPYLNRRFPVGGNI